MSKKSITPKIVDLVKIANPTKNLPFVSQT